MIDLRSIFDTERGLRMKVAKALRITHGAVSQWRKVPAERVLAVSKIIEVPPHRLRPDLYPPPGTDDRNAA